MKPRHATQVAGAVSPLSMPTALRVVALSALLTYAVLTVWVMALASRSPLARDGVIVAVYWLVATSFILTRTR